MVVRKSFLSLVVGLSLLVASCRSTPNSNVDHKQQAAILRLSTKIATMKYYEKDWVAKKEDAVNLKKFLLETIYDETFVPGPGKSPPFLNVENITPTGITLAVVKTIIEESSLKYADKELAKELVNILAVYLDDAIKNGNTEVPSYYLDYAKAAVSGVTSGIEVLEHQSP